jgi:MYXO-CTERM domain-containing protein
VKVSTILAHYRQLYTPASGSPLVGAGDPTNDAHNNIGAIGQGSSLDPGDQFGTFMPGNDGGPPPLNLPDGGATGRGPDGGPGAADSGASLGDGGTSADAGTSRDAGPSSSGHGTSGCGCGLAGASHRARAGLGLLLFVVAAARMRRRRWSRREG